MPKVSGLLMGILSIIAGILIIFIPSLLHWIVGIYLIVIGILALLALRSNHQGCQRNAPTALGNSHH